MKVQGKWGKHKFTSNTKKVMEMESFSTSAKSKSKDSKSKHKKIELQDVSFSVSCHAGAGADVEKEFYAWRSDIGSANYLYIHGQKVKTNPLKLTEVTLSDVRQDFKGRLLYGKIALKFTEKNSSSKKSGSKSGASKSEKNERKKTKVKK